MKIKLNKDWRYAGEIQKAGVTLDIRNEKIIEYLKNNGFIKEKKEKVVKEKTAKKIIN
tara:strand:+ start:433 stop:606 length:174 start_codon:yes stop_codon:yes gene_type:complete